MTINEAIIQIESIKKFELGKRTIDGEYIEALDMAIQALEDKRAYCTMAGRPCFAHGTQIAWCLSCPHISEEDRRLVVKAVEGIGKKHEHDE